MNAPHKVVSQVKKKTEKEKKRFSDVLPIRHAVIILLGISRLLADLSATVYPASLFSCNIQFLKTKAIPSANFIAN